jgi:hypothetical protein
MAIVKDRALRELLLAGRPTLVVPSPATVSRDIKVCFEHCQEQVGRLLRICAMFFYLSIQPINFVH